MISLGTTSSRPASRPLRNLVDRERALSEAALDHSPLSSGEQTREPIGGVWFCPLRGCRSRAALRDPLGKPDPYSLPLLNAICSSSSSTGSKAQPRGVPSRARPRSAPFVRESSHESDVTNLGLLHRDRVKELVGEVFDDTAMRQRR